MKFTPSTFGPDKLVLTETDLQRLRDGEILGSVSILISLEGARRSTSEVMRPEGIVTVQQPDYGAARGEL